MSVWIRPGVMVRIEQMNGAHAPRPLPLESGFSLRREYEILGLHCPSESAEAYCILKNDDDQIWFISNRHLRVAPERAASMGTLQRHANVRLISNGKPM